MPRADIDAILDRCSLLAKEINSFVPDDARSVQFRADLAGLLIVTMAASYESCVKETLINFATKQHPTFGIFAENNYKKLSSRVSLSDLYRYAGTFDATINHKFKSLIEQRKGRLIKKIGKDFTSAYSQILNWRHDFAHAGKRNTTVDEAIRTHRLAKRVLYTFDDAFN